MKRRTGLLFWLMKCCSLLGVALGAVLSGPIHRDGERILDDLSDPASYEIITPIKVTPTGEFVSHDLTHAHEFDVGGRASGSTNKRRKRGVQELNSIVHYSIPIGDEHHLVELEPNHLFLAPHAVLERRSKFDPELDEEASRIGNVTSRTSVIGRAPRCHFIGRVFNHTSSKAALSTCDGLKGFLKTRHGEYLIEPLQGFNRSADQPHPHKIYRRSAPTSHSSEDRHADGTCGTKNFEDALKEREIWEREKRQKEISEGIGEEDSKVERHRSKRSVSVERNVEVMVVADKEMINFYSNEDLNTYILTIMNMVSSIYHDASIGNAVNIIVVRIMLLETPQYEEELYISHDADDTLESFCKWQQMINPASESHPHHHDVAVLLTRYNICSRSNAHCSTLGLAEIAGMCQPHRSCNVNEDTGLQIAYTIAHEIGHNFGMNHDSVVNGCGTSYGVSQHVMSPHLSTDSIPITWSNCSRSEITNFLDREWGTCLVDEPHEVEYNFPQLPPGAMYDANHQCRLAFGANAFHCDGIELACQTLWCRVDNRCVTRLEAAAEGTQCGKHKWCSSGKCVTMGDRPAAIHGNWGKWSEWSSCSRSCGAGVELATRLCDNPPPANGGKYCTGDRRRYRICNTEDCPESAVSFRSVQCSAFDNKPYKERNYTWAPVTLENSPCQLNCKPDNEFYSVELKDSVVDGTPCRPGTRDMCIHGICKKVSCDWTIEGTAQEDRCGLCHGDGTQCVTTGGSFNQTRGVSYVEVVTFPVGALKVRVEEAGDAANYFAIKDKQSGTFYLNGNWIIQWSGEYSAAGVMMYYKRENETETLFLPGPLKKALTLMILFQTENPGLHWEYTTPHENATYTPEFHWHSSDWSVCTRTCGGGTQISKAQCLEKEAGLVEDKYCENKQRPEDEKRECNTHACPAWWWAGPWQPCSVTCGNHGNRRRTVICVRSYGPTEQMALMDSDCSMPIKPHEEEECPDLSPCQTDFSWSVGPWIETCRGDPCEFERREVLCQETIAPCDPLTRPPERRQCGNITCGRWEADQWGQCSATCGEGVQIRIVECVDGVACSQADEPGSVRECKMADCHVVADSLSFASNSEETVPELEDEVESSFQLNETKETYHDEVPTNSPSPEITSKEREIEPHDNETVVSAEVLEEPPDDLLNELSGSSEELSEESEGQNVSGTSAEDKNDTVVEVLKEQDTVRETELDTLESENKNSTSPPKDLNTASTEETEEKYQTHAEDGTTKTTNLSDNNEIIGGIVNNVSEDSHLQESTETSIVDSKNKSTPDSVLHTSIKDFDYETAPDDYYEFDPQEIDVNRRAPSPKKKIINDKKVKETDEIKTILENDMDAALNKNSSSNNAEKIITNNDEDEANHSDSQISEEAINTKVGEEDVEDKQNEVTIENEVKAEVEKVKSEDHENNEQETNIDAEKEAVLNPRNVTNATAVTEQDVKNYTNLPKKANHNMTNSYDNYDYYSDGEYYDDYYYDPNNDYNSTNDNSTANETLVLRPDGFVEDKLDIDSVQVIELRMKKTKRGGKKKYRHKKNKKEKIRKVKIHTGADAIRVLNKLSKRGNAKTTKKNNRPIADTFTDDALGSIYKWTVGQWSECSEPCGGGQQERNVECQNASSGRVVPSWECHALRPSDLQKCNTFECLNWSASDFGPCSVTCGTGTRLRSVSCPQEGRCHPQGTPPLSEECAEAPCVNWVEGPWSMCTKSCGGGYQIRYVKCVDARTQEASQDCGEDRPPHKRVCNANQCQTKSQGQQHHCKDSLDTKLCRRLVHMCTTKFFRVKCCRTCLRHRG